MGFAFDCILVEESVNYLLNQFFVKTFGSLKNQKVKNSIDLIIIRMRNTL